MSKEANKVNNNWNVKPLGDILTNRQITKAVSIWKEKGSVETKEYFRSLKGDLAKKGVDADYLFYAFEFFVTPSLN